MDGHALTNFVNFMRQLHGFNVLSHSMDLTPNTKISNAAYGNLKLPFMVQLKCSWEAVDAKFMKKWGRWCEREIFLLKFCGEIVVAETRGECWGLVLKI